MELVKGLAGQAFQTHYFLPCQSVNGTERNPELVHVDVFFFKFCPAVWRQFSREAQVDPSVVEGGELLVRSHFIKL